MFKGEDRYRVLEHSSNIFYHLAIGTMVLCYLATIVFSFDLLGYFALFALFVILGAVWIVVGVIGCVTALIALDGYRAFLGSLGGFVMGLFKDDSVSLITDTIVKISAYYPIIAVIPPIAIALSLVLKGINKTLKDSRREIATLSVMGALYIVSLIMSIILISRFGGGTA